VNRRDASARIALCDAADLHGRPLASWSGSAVARRQEEEQMAASATRPNPLARTGPFTLLQRFLIDDIANVFDQSGARNGPATGSGKNSDLMTWAPKVDVKQRGNDLVISADLPGVHPTDIAVEVTEDAVVIAGQRDEEKVEDSGDVYKVERKFGAFFREVPLPQGAIVDQAKATFKDGVLEISVPAPAAQASRGRRLEIQSGSTTRDTQQPAQAQNSRQSTR
jgi:HSP20 family protein